MLQSAAVCCSVLQCVAALVRVGLWKAWVCMYIYMHACMCCSVLECVVECCSVLQCVAVQALAVLWEAWVCMHTCMYTQMHAYIDAWIDRVRYSLHMTHAYTINVVSR